MSDTFNAAYSRPGEHPDFHPQFSTLLNLPGPILGQKLRSKRLFAIFTRVNASIICNRVLNEAVRQG